MTEPGDARFKMIWGGEWRPVTYMADRDNRQTNDPFHAAKAVLYVGPDQWVSTLVSPGDIMKRSEIPVRKWNAVAS